MIMKPKAFETKENIFRGADIKCSKGKTRESPAGLRSGANIISISEGTA
jgi:hypothetical protein